MSFPLWVREREIALPARRAAPAVSPPSPPMVLAAVRAAELDLYPARPFTLATAHTTDRALELLASGRPDVVAIDWDAPGIDAAAVCDAAVAAPARTLAITAAEGAPAALKTGCHAVLLRPFAPTLFATRVGRLLREKDVQPGGPAKRRRTPGPAPAVPCARCGAPGAVAFEFSSYRRVWIACLACEHVWLERTGKGGTP